MYKPITAQRIIKMFKYICFIVLFLLTLSGCEKNTEQEEKSTIHSQSSFTDEETSEHMNEKLTPSQKPEQLTENEMVAYTKNKNKVKIGDIFEVEGIEYCISEVETSKNTFSTPYESNVYFKNQLDNEGRIPNGKTLILLTISAKNISSESQDVNFNKSFCTISDNNQVIECFSEGCIMNKPQTGNQTEDFFIYALSPDEEVEVQVGYLVSDESLTPELYYCVGYLGSQADLDINRFVELEIP